MFLFVAAHKVRWCCVMTLFCDVIVCCCSQSVLVVCLTGLCDVIVCCCSQTVLVVCLTGLCDVIVCYCSQKLMVLCFDLIFVMLLFVVAHNL